MVFGRVDYERYDSGRYLLYSDLDETKYPRNTYQIPSGENSLTAYLYGADNSNGLMIISPGHGDANDIKLYEISFDKNLYMQHDMTFMDHLNDFLLDAVSQK